MIREAINSDADAIAEIYNYYIVNTNITFELEPVSALEISDRISHYKTIGPYLVYEDNNTILGYAYVSKFRERKAYDNSVESTIYLRNGVGGHGIGFKLYSTLLQQIESKYHVVIGVIALPNDASVKLHEKCGFKKVGHLTEVGYKFNKWIDVGYWQKQNEYI